MALMRARPAPRPRAFGETKTEPIFALCSCLINGFVSKVAIPINHYL